MSNTYCTYDTARVLLEIVKLLSVITSWAEIKFETYLEWHEANKCDLIVRFIVRFNVFFFFFNIWPEVEVHSFVLSPHYHAVTCCTEHNFWADIVEIIYSNVIILSVWQFACYYRWCTWRKRRCSALNRSPPCCWPSWRRQRRMH